MSGILENTPMVTQAMPLIGQTQPRTEKETKPTVLIKLANIPHLGLIAKFLTLTERMVFSQVFSLLRARIEILNFNQQLSNSGKQYFINRAVQSDKPDDLITTIKSFPLASMEFTDDRGKTLVHYAATDSTYFEVITILVKAKADINLTDYNTQTPLMYAARKKHVEGIKLLLESKANIESKDRKGFTALHWVAKKDCLAGTQLLLDKKADVNARDEEDRPSLHWAAKKGADEIVKLLLKSKAMPELRAASLETPLHFAAESNEPRVIKRLAKIIEVNTIDKYGETPLFSAVQSNKPNSVKALLECKADINIKNITQQTALEQATTAKKKLDPSIIKMLTL